MDNIIVFDDKSQTETTLILNDNDEVIGVETYFATPRQVSAFFNKNETYSRQNLNKQKIFSGEAGKLGKFNPTPPTSLFVGENGPKIRSMSFDSPDSNVKFETTKATPCGGPRQRPCR